MCFALPLKIKNLTNEGVHAKVNLCAAASIGFYYLLYWTKRTKHFSKDVEAQIKQVENNLAGRVKIEGEQWNIRRSDGLLQILWR